MAWALFIFGIVAIQAAWKNRTDELFAILKQNFTGQSSFIVWVIAIIFIALIGINKTLRPISDGFLTLIIVVILLNTYKNNRNLLELFISEVKKGTSGNG